MQLIHAMIYKNKDIEKMVLKQEIVKAIQDDPILFGKIAFILDVKPVTLPRILIANGERLTQASVLKILREHLGIKKDNELLEESEGVIS